MELFRAGKVGGSLLLLAIVGSIGQLTLRAGDALSGEAVVRKAVAHAQQAQASAGLSAYTYTKVAVTEELDPAGHVKERKQKVYRVSFQDGSTRAQLLEVNGHAPAPADLKKQAENDMNLNQILGQPKSAKGDNRESFLTQELANRFVYSLRGQQKLNGRLAYQVAFEPKIPEPPVRRMVDRLLNSISGTLWIDAEEFEVARVDVQLRSEVDFLGGLVGKLKKLAFTMTRTRVAEGLWLNSFSAGNFEGRKLLDSMRIKTQSQSTGFRPLAMQNPPEATRG